MKRHLMATGVRAKLATGALVLVFLLNTAIASALEQVQQGPAMNLQPEDRLLVLAPHPDDEVLGCGGIIEAAVKLGCEVRVVYFTHGDANEKSFLVYRKHPVVEPAAVRKMAMIRSLEAVAACRVLGLNSNALTFLGYPDGGTLEIWRRHWGTNPPCRSKLTKAVAVPYPNALRPGADYKGEEIVADLKQVTRQFKPTRILVSHPGDHHPDHRSLPLFLMLALWELKGEVEPEVFSYLVHYKHWPVPRRYHPRAKLLAPESLIPSGQWRMFPLENPAVETKHEALKQHKTQYEYSAWFLSSFIRENELFDRLDFLRINGGLRELLLASHTPGHVEAAPEFLQEDEKASYVGIEQLVCSVEAGKVILEVDFGRPLAGGAEVVLAAYGWRPDVAYSKMPKLELGLNNKGRQVRDQHNELAPAMAEAEVSPESFRVKVPLESLGFPQRLFVSARTVLEEVPLDWTAWRILVLEPD